MKVNLRKLIKLKLKKAEDFFKKYLEYDELGEQRCYTNIFSLLQ